MLDVVLKDCVTETKETSWWSNVSTSLAKSASERVRRSHESRPAVAMQRTTMSRLYHRSQVHDKFNENIGWGARIRT
jgi:hypothetical protein